MTHWKTFGSRKVIGWLKMFTFTLFVQKRRFIVGVVNAATVLYENVQCAAILYVVGQNGHVVFCRPINHIDFCAIDNHLQQICASIMGPTLVCLSLSVCLNVAKLAGFITNLSPIFDIFYDQSISFVYLFSVQNEAITLTSAIINCEHFHRNNFLRMNWLK